MTESDDIRRLLAYREAVVRSLEHRARLAPLMSAIGFSVLFAFIAWLGFALWNGAVGIAQFGGLFIVGALLAFVMTRRINFFGDRIYVFDIVFLHPVAATDTDDELRQQLAECDARIAELKARNARSA